MALFRRIVLDFVIWSAMAAAAMRRAPGPLPANQTKRGGRGGHARDVAVVAPRARSLIRLRTSSHLKADKWFHMRTEISGIILQESSALELGNALNSHNFLNINLYVLCSETCLALDKEKGLLFFFFFAYTNVWYSICVLCTVL